MRFQQISGLYLPISTSTPFSHLTPVLTVFYSRFLLQLFYFKSLAHMCKTSIKLVSRQSREILKNFIYSLLIFWYSFPNLMQLHKSKLLLFSFFAKMSLKVTWWCNTSGRHYTPHILLHILHILHILQASLTPAPYVMFAASCMTGCRLHSSWGESHRFTPPTPPLNCGPSALKLCHQPRLTL